MCVTFKYIPIRLFEIFGEAKKINWLWLFVAVYKKINSVEKYGGDCVSTLMVMYIVVMECSRQKMGVHNTHSHPSSATSAPSHLELNALS